MAESTCVASDLPALAAFVSKASTTLYKTIRDFQYQPKHVRDLIEELEALSGVLRSLIDVVTTTEVDLSMLNLPLLRCGEACEEFGQEVRNCSLRSCGSRTSFRDWAKLRYMGDDINGFRLLLSGYKSTFHIAIVDANLRKSSITAENLKSYRHLIETTTDDIESRLQSIDESLEKIIGNTSVQSNSEVIDLRLIKEEQQSAQKRLQICAQLSVHIDQIQGMPRRNSRSYRSINLEALPEKVINEGQLLMKQRSRETFTVGWICALPHELTASKAMLDEEYAKFDEQEDKDDNMYIAGKIGNHEVIMACQGKTGRVSANEVANKMMSSFPSIRFGLIVGIGGAVPETEDIRLGDVVVSQPTDEHGGVVQYDMGKELLNGGFRIRGHLNKPPTILLNALRLLQAEHEARGSKISQYISEGLQKFPRMRQRYEYPGTNADHLYEAQCEHGEELDCPTCGKSKEVIRIQRRDWTGKIDIDPHIFYGLIGSGDRVVASSKARRRLCASANILCFEMEAAGLMDSFPCIVVRGMSDYADAHRHDQWQRYAAIAAAAYTKELLEQIPAKKIKQTYRAAAAMDSQIGSSFGASDYAPKSVDHLMQVHRSTRDC